MVKDSMVICSMAKKLFAGATSSLAPYLFLLAGEALNTTIRKEEQRIGRIQGMGLLQSQRHQLIVVQYMNNTSFTAMAWQECISHY
jgi:hypothetical protein